MESFIEVIEPGAWTALQDQGRFGHRAIGVPVAGAVDLEALILANRLVGNDPETAALEMTYQGPVLTASCDLVAAVWGAPMVPFLNGRPGRVGQSFLWPRGTQLSFVSGSWGCRSYLALAGGIPARQVLGSRSLDARGGFGGVFGRPLRAGDRLPCEGCTDPLLVGRRLERPLECPPDPVELRFVPGPEEGLFSSGSIADFYSSEYRVAIRSDRMGLVLEGQRLTSERFDIISSPTVFGTVQVPASGTPIILMADGQTTGGYPRLAVLIGADRSKAAQLRAGSAIRPRECSLREARDALQASFLRASTPVLPSPETWVGPI